MEYWNTLLENTRSIALLFRKIDINYFAVISNYLDDTFDLSFFL